MSVRLAVLGISICGALAACTGAPQYTFQADQTQRAIDRWISCDECSDHQLYHLKLVGEPAVQPLEELLDTPSVGFPANIDGVLQERFRALRAHNPGMRISEDAFIAVHKAALANRIRARAILALEQLSPGSVSDAEVTRVRRTR